MLRNECKEGNIKNLNRGDPFKKLQKTRGFFVTEKTFRKRKNPHTSKNLQKRAYQNVIFLFRVTTKGYSHYF